MNRLIGLLTILAFLTRPALTAPSCSTVKQQLVPCLGFIKDITDRPSDSCCSGTKEIGDQTKTQGDRQAICECLKNILAVAGTYDKNRIPQIPKTCGVPISLPPIDSSTDCSRAITEYVF
ncbi:non-specific lipid-transfer protein-like [Mangifera indica]|uniref:non-specific lipid-transfer protein-like n=1 Tax=Mangifera indica TaxID=29780 RepID=UPI001CFB7E44|nr:non-specific lipid-transfer protein-like [Mangifera indica]